MKKHIFRWILATGFLIIFSTGNAWATDQGISVWLDGTEISFSDTAPIVRDGKTYIPLRTLFEAMGIKVSYESSSKTVTAVRNDRTVSFVVGQSSLQITENSETKTLTTGSSCFAENDRIMIPTRFAADCFDMNVGWDSKHQTVVLTDVDKLMQTVKGQFSNMNAYLTYTNQFRQQTYGIVGEMSTMMEVKDQNGDNIPLTTNSTIDGLIANETAQITMHNETDLTQLLEDISGEEAVKNADLLSFMKENIATLYIHQAEGTAYVQSPLYNMLGGVSENAWYQTSLDSVYEMYNMDSDLIKLVRMEGNSIEKVMAEYLQNVEVTDRKDTIVTKLFQLYKSAFTDNNFSNSNNGLTAIGSITTDNNQIYMIQPTLKMRNNEVIGYQFSITERTENTTKTMNVSMASDNSMIIKFSHITNNISSGTKITLQFTKENKPLQTEPAEGSSIFSIQRLASLFGM